MQLCNRVSVHFVHLQTNVSWTISHAVTDCCYIAVTCNGIMDVAFNGLWFYLLQSGRSLQDHCDHIDSLLLLTSCCVQENEWNLAGNLWIVSFVKQQVECQSKSPSYMSNVDINMFNWQFTIRFHWSCVTYELPENQTLDNVVSYSKYLIFCQGDPIIEGCADKSKLICDMGIHVLR